MDGDVITVERLIEAAPEAILAYLADASKHAEIDGSGSVQGAKRGSLDRLSLGARFSLSMKIGLP